VTRCTPPAGPQSPCPSGRDPGCSITEATLSATRHTPPSGPRGHPVLAPVHAAGRPGSPCPAGGLDRAISASRSPSKVEARVRSRKDWIITHHGPGHREAPAGHPVRRATPIYMAICGRRPTLPLQPLSQRPQPVYVASRTTLDAELRAVVGAAIHGARLDLCSPKRVDRRPAGGGSAPNIATSPCQPAMSRPARGVRPISPPPLADHHQRAGLQGECAQYRHLPFAGFARCCCR
jgi:hypothetical protein